MRTLGVFAVLAASCGAPLATTAGQACDEVAGPFCHRAVECGVGPAGSEGDCLRAFTGACCADDNNCDVEITATSSKLVRTCSDRIGTESCSYFAPVSLPGYCTNVITPK